METTTHSVTKCHNVLQFAARCVISLCCHAPAGPRTKPGMVWSSWGPCHEPNSAPVFGFQLEGSPSPDHRWGKKKVDETTLHVRTSVGKLYVSPKFRGPSSKRFRLTFISCFRSGKVQWSKFAYSVVSAEGKSKLRKLVPSHRLAFFDTFPVYFHM